MKEFNQNMQATTVGELVATDYRKAEVLRKYKIDFCCGGKQSLQDACNRKGVSVQHVMQELDELEQKEHALNENFSEWGLDLLTTYIEQTHHRYVMKSIPVLFEYSRKVARVHGEHHQETVLIADLFAQVADELQMHMKKEEMVLFPYIQELTEAERFNEKPVVPPFRSAANPIRMMEMEHELAGQLMLRIAELSGNYSPPADACGTFKVLYAKLDEFERDLHKHVHLENNILFPAAIRLEEKLMGRPE